MYNFFYDLIFHELVQELFLLFLLSSVAPAPAPAPMGQRHVAQAPRAWLGLELKETKLYYPLIK